MKRLDASELSALFIRLHESGYAVIGPTLRDGAIAWDEITSPADLPRGFTDTHAPARYRVERGAEQAYFGFVVSPQSPKRFLFPPRQKLWSADISGGKFRVEPQDEPTPKLAFLGVRSCELAAIRAQDQVFLGGQHPDPIYSARREQALLIVVQCTKAAPTCFCPSMNTGPKASQGFDLAATEVVTPEEHYFVMTSGSPKGDAVLQALPARDATKDETARAFAAEANAVTQISRRLETRGLRETLAQNLEHPLWDEIATRCLSCANCTMVCPTCFCSTVEDVTDLTGDHVDRWRRMDSCFTNDFSYMHGGSVRTRTSSKYRQWLTHKLSSWWDQFGESGCVGCGRCITWCPSGIDITEEARRFIEWKA